MNFGRSILREILTFLQFRQLANYKPNFSCRINFSSKNLGSMLMAEIGFYKLNLYDLNQTQK